MQFVKLGQHQSPAVGLDAGVPQGSVLGPLLFAVYCSPAADVIVSHGVQFNQYSSVSPCLLTTHPTVCLYSLRVLLTSDNGTYKNGCSSTRYATYCRPIWNTYTSLQSDPDETGLLQLDTVRRASQQHPEVAACAEQCSQNRPPDTEAVPCQTTADASTTLTAVSTQN